VAFIACVVISSIFVMRAWVKFYKSPMVVNVETTSFPIYRLYFPAVTICPAMKIKKTVGIELLSR
jgi:hypothetical protein